ncbi:MAG: ATP-binding protein [Bacteroidota bacterium]|nr:ATP-binding protein [Bacteroidota bacterium]
MENPIQTEKDATRMLENLLENLPGLAYRCNFDRNYTMQYLSQGCFPLTGWRPEELLDNKKESYENLILKEDRDLVWSAVMVGVKNKKHFEMAYRILTKTGKVKWVKERGNGIYNELSGELEFLEGFITDITKEHEANRMLAEREQSLKEIMKVVDIGILFVDKSGIILDANKAFAEMTGINNNDIINFKAISLARKLLKPANFNKILPLIMNRLAGKEIPPYILTFNKRILRVVTSTTESNKITAFFTDITRQKEYEDHILHAKIKAEESDRLKTTFLANMSHEIRTPMNGIVGFTELLRDTDLKDNEKFRYIDIIHANSEQLLHVINDILDISRIEAGRLGIFPHSFDPFPMLRYLEDTAKILVEHKPITVSLKYDLPVGASIQSDKNRLQQVLFNLISNAVKFTRQGSIEIGCYRNSFDHIEFYVKDSGSGIPKEAGQQIFDRFRQAEEGDNRPFGGSGLGLSICKALVQLLGGRIGFTSTYGKGSHFYFSIPDQLTSFE